MEMDKKYLKMEGKSDEFIYGAIQTYEKVLANAQRMILAGEVKEIEIAHLLREWVEDRDTLISLLGPSTYVSLMHAYAEGASRERTKKSVVFPDVGLDPNMEPLMADGYRSTNVEKND
jgi:hypothetical protein